LKRQTIACYGEGEEVEEAKDRSGKGESKRMLQQMRQKIIKAVSEVCLVLVMLRSWALLLSGATDYTYESTMTHVYVSPDIKRA
jgi:hypothetical protein